MHQNQYAFLLLDSNPKTLFFQTSRSYEVCCMSKADNLRSEEEKPQFVNSFDHLPPWFCEISFDYSTQPYTYTLQKIFTIDRDEGKMHRIESENVATNTSELEKLIEKELRKIYQNDTLKLALITPAHLQSEAAKAVLAKLDVQDQLIDFHDATLREKLLNDLFILKTNMNRSSDSDSKNFTFLSTIFALYHQAIHPAIAPAVTTPVNPETVPLMFSTKASKRKNDDNLLTLAELKNMGNGTSERFSTITFKTENLSKEVLSYINWVNRNSNSVYFKARKDPHTLEVSMNFAMKTNGLVSYEDLQDSIKDYEAYLALNAKPENTTPITGRRKVTPIFKRC